MYRKSWDTAKSNVAYHWGKRGHLTSSVIVYDVIIWSIWSICDLEAGQAPHNQVRMSISQDTKKCDCFDLNQGHWSCTTNWNDRWAMIGIWGLWDLFIAVCWCPPLHAYEMECLAMEQNGQASTLKMYVVQYQHLLWGRHCSTRWTWFWILAGQKLPP